MWIAKRVDSKETVGEKTLDFSKALKIAQSMEMEERKSSELKDSGSSGMLKTEEVHWLGAKARKPKTFSKEKGEKSKGACYRCGNTEHNSSECKYKKYRCDACGKVGHLKKVCRSKESNDAKYIETANNCDDLHDSLGFFTIREQNAQAATVTMTVEGKALVLEVDTGASVTVIPNKMFKEELGHLKLRPASTSLKTYTGTELPLCGETEVHVEYQGHSNS